MGKVKQTSSFSFYACILLGFICMICGFAFMPLILNTIGASENTYSFARSYLNVLFAGVIPIVLSFSFGQIIRAEGAAKEFMAGMMGGTLLNIILNPIFIFGFHLGIAGSSLATVVANTASVVYYMYYFVRKSKVISIAPKYFHMNVEIIKDILIIGIPASLSDILLSLATTVLYTHAAIYGDRVVAAMGIVSRITMIPIMLCFGLGQGIQPLVGYNWGAKNIKRMRSVIRFSTIVGTAICIVFTVLFYAADNFMIRIFINDTETITLGSEFLRIAIVSLPTIAVQLVLVNSFQAMGKAIPSLIFSISRQGLIFIPAIIILNSVVGLTGVISAQPTADILTGILTLILYFVLTKGFPDEYESNAGMAVKDNMQKLSNNL